MQAFAQSVEALASSKVNSSSNGMSGLSSGVSSPFAPNKKRGSVLQDRNKAEIRQSAVSNNAHSGNSTPVSATLQSPRARRSQFMNSSDKLKNQLETSKPAKSASRNTSRVNSQDSKKGQQQTSGLPSMSNARISSSTHTRAASRDSGKFFQETLNDKLGQGVSYPLYRPLSYTQSTWQSPRGSMTSTIGRWGPA